MNSRNLFHGHTVTPIKEDLYNINIMNKLKEISVVGLGVLWKQLKFVIVRPTEC